MIWTILLFHCILFCNHSFQSRSTIYNLSSESEHFCHPTLHLQLCKWVLLLQWLYRDTFLRSLAASQWEKKRKSFGLHERPSLSESVASTEAETSTEAEQPVSSSDTTGAGSLTLCSLRCHTVMSCCYALSLPLLVFLSMVKVPVIIQRLNLFLLISEALLNPNAYECVMRVSVVIYSSVCVCELSWITSLSTLCMSTPWGYCTYC